MHWFSLFAKKNILHKLFAGGRQDTDLSTLGSDLLKLFRTNMLILFLWSVWLYYVFLHFDKRLCDFGFTFNNWFYYIFKTSDCPWKIDWLLFSVHVNSVSTIFMTRKLLQQYIILVKSWHWDGLACKCLYLGFFLTLNIFLFFLSCTNVQMFDCHKEGQLEYKDASLFYFSGMFTRRSSRI